MNRYMALFSARSFAGLQRILLSAKVDALVLVILVVGWKRTGNYDAVVNETLGVPRVNYYSPSAVSHQLDLRRITPIINRLLDRLLSFGREEKGKF